ncbi:MAG: PQQ-binding-like beta-propeller repeat protein [Planctomycetaceae bacterium]|nr:PQQ-binding-like beta-propeller repeat protein [Planctomycetaceae bacterium]
MYGCDAGNTFCNRNEKTLAPPLAEVWEFECPGYVDGVVVSSGILLAGGSDDHKQEVFALDARNGRHLWTFTLPGGGGGAIGSTPACCGDLAFFGGQNDRNVYAVHLRTGELRWQQGEIKSMFGVSPKVIDGAVYVNSVQSGLWAFDANTGKKLWGDEALGRQADIAVIANTLLRPGGAYGGALVALDTRNGQQCWTHADGSTSFGMAATEDLVFATYAGASPVEVPEGDKFKRFTYDRIAAFRTRDGKKAWETVLKQDALYSGLLVAEDRLYVASRQGSICSLDSGTGELRVDRPFKEGWGQLIGTSDLIFVSSRDAVLALAPDSLKTRWAISVPGFQHLAAANGKLYVAAGSKIIAFANAKPNDE